MRGIKLVHRLFKKKLERETKCALDDLSSRAARHQEAVSHRLAALDNGRSPRVQLGKTEWGQRITVPVDLLAQHGAILGSSGAGKSYIAISLISQILSNSSGGNRLAFGVLDAKGELFERVVAYLYAHLYRLRPPDRARFLHKIVLIDFSSSAAITSYNLLAPKVGTSNELVVANRIESISDQFSGLSEVTARMKTVMKYLFLLMAEFRLPLSFCERLCGDPYVLNRLAERSKDGQVKDYFAQRFRSESAATILAVRQRLDSLFISEGVRLSLSASTAPDFAALQDEGQIVLINTAGRNITRGISELLQGLILSDIKQSVFQRIAPDSPFLWFFDEAQNLYRTAANREHMVELLTMARSFGSYFVLLTQSLTSAVRDQDILNSILTNVRWLILLRSTLRDSGLISTAIPLTGRMTKARNNPFEPPRLLSDSEELKSRLNEITRFPDRTAYCWLKAHLPSAVRMTTPQVPPPHEVAGCSRSAFEDFLKSERMGGGVSRAEILREIEQHESRLRELLYDEHSPATHPSSMMRPAGKQKAKPLVKRLEEEYAKKNRRD
jgi:hypothetical protein